MKHIAILGLTVLAIGNSVADWVADTVVTLKGKPEMGLASCFGAPLITSVMGLSFALIVSQRLRQILLILLFGYFSSPFSDKDIGK